MTTIQVTPISEQTINEYRKAFEGDSAAKVSQNAVSMTTIDDIALVRDIVQSTDFTFSTHLDDWKVTNQKKSGRCWLFAALNMLRVPAMKKMMKYKIIGDKTGNKDGIIISLIAALVNKSTNLP